MQTDTSHAGRRVRSPRFLEQPPPMPTCRPTLQQHVVVDCMIHKAPDGFAGLRRPDAATMYWLKDLNIEM